MLVPIHTSLDTQPDRRRGRFGLIVLSLLAASCMKPDVEADLFPGEGSAVTGTEDADEPEGKSEPDEDSTQPSDREDEDDQVPAATVQRDAGATAPPQVPSETGMGGPKLPLDAGSSGSARDAGTNAPAVSADAGPPAAAASALRKLTFQVTTVTARGRYSPKNILAIWVVDAQGKFVKTLAKHAGIRGRWLSGWNAASRGNVVDAMTSATLTSHTPRTVSWDLTDVMKKPVPDGDYKLMVEFTEKDGTGVSTTVPFSKTAPLQLMPPDAANFTKMSLVLE